MIGRRYFIWLLVFLTSALQVCTGSMKAPPGLGNGVTAGSVEHRGRKDTPSTSAPEVPKLGISTLPKGPMSEWTDASFTEAFRKAAQGGFRVAIWRHAWGEIEPTLGAYRWDDLDYEVAKTAAQGMEYALVLEIIHTNALGTYPADIAFTTFDDPTFVQAFRAFIQALLQRYPGKIRYLWLGNEVNAYLHEHLDQVTPFLNLFRQFEAQVRAVDPGILTGIVGAYHLARNDGELAMLQRFAAEGDAIGLTVYMEDDDAAPEVSETRSYFEELLSAFPGRKVAIIETAWSSAGPRGSEQAQANYVRELASVLATYSKRFPFFSWFILYDLPPDLNRQVAVSFGVCPPQPPDPPWCTAFLTWQGSLAMLDNDGRPKPAWGVWQQEIAEAGDRSPRLALWLAKKDELLAHERAAYDLVMTAWFEPAEAEAIRTRRPSVRLLAGLTHTWVLDDPDWQRFLVTVANGGDPNGPLQITDDMYLMFDDDGDGTLDRRCSPPGWPNIYAMDPRHPGWRRLILAFYATVAQQPQHDGVIVDMVDANPFCEGAWSAGVPVPLDAATWVSAQEELLGLIRQQVPADKWVFANAGRDFPPGSPFPQHVNGYLLENFLGSWGASLEEGLASAQRALEATQPPHAVVFAVDTDDTGSVDWARFRTGLVASLLLDNTYFAFDYGSRGHGGVIGWWFPGYYEVVLGAPLGPYTFLAGVYRRDFERGTVVAAPTSTTTVTFTVPHRDIATGEVGTAFTVPQGDARIFVSLEAVYLPLVVKS
jgi:hypothetical protein